MSIVLTLLADDKRFIVASKSHNEKYGKPETPSDLKQHKIVSLTGLEV